MRFGDLIASSTTAMVAMLATTVDSQVLSEKTLLPASVFLVAIVWAIKVTREWTKTDSDREHRLKRIESELHELKASLPCMEDRHEKKCTVCGGCIGQCSCDD